MKSKRFTEEMIIRILREAEAGLSVTDVCRKHNCPEQSFYRWKAKFVGMEVSESIQLMDNEWVDSVIADHRNCVHSCLL